MRPRSSALLPIMLMAALAAMSGATSPAIRSLLQSYSVPNSLIGGLSQVNITYDGAGYAALYSSGQLYFLVNESSDSFVLNQQEIFSIIRNYTVSKSYSSANFSQIGSTMHYYMETASAPLTDCASEVGLLGSSGASCTLQNYCESCKTVSYCSKVLNEVGGPDTPTGYGFINFDQNYTWLNENLTVFYSTINTVSPGNINASLASLNSSFNNIYKITTTIWKNPIFPPTANISAEEVSQCPGYGASSSNLSLIGAPWFCNAVAFCPYLTAKDSSGQPVYSGDGFNFTVLSEIKSEIDGISSLPLSNAQIEGIAASANGVTAQYIAPELVKEQTNKLDTLLNTTLASYAVTLNASTGVLKHISNASLAASLAALQANYSILTKQYLSINVTKQAALVSSQLARVSSTYSKVNATYSSLVSESNNNTGTIVRLQLDGNENNAQLNSLAFAELRVNSELSGSVSNTIAVKAQLDSVQEGLGKISSGENPAVSLSRYLGGASAEAITPAMGLPYSAAVALAPFTASIPALIIGIVGLVLIGMAYMLSKPKKQHELAPRQKKKQGISNKVLALAAVVLILYMIISVALSFGDNGSAPISTFASSLASSKSAVLALNGTETNGMLLCSSEIQSRLKSMGKTIIPMWISGNKCTVSNTTLTTDTCLNSYAAKGIPVIMLTNSTSSSISAYSFYGSVLQESGNSTGLSRCTAAQII